MSSSKNKDYDVEKIVSKRTDGKGQVFYLIKWKGYSTADNTWEPVNNVNNCPELVKAFEAEHAAKTKTSSKKTEARISTRSARSSVLSSKKPTNDNKKRDRSRSAPSRTNNKSLTSHNSNFTDDEDENDDDDDDDNNNYLPKKSTRSPASKRLRKSTSDTEVTPSINSNDSDILDIAKLDNILDVRRNKKTNTLEYQIQVKKNKKTFWVKSYQLTDDYHQQVIDFLEEKYV
ncbi:unnamed protein product [Adineta steineri]|uniref:Chromo domain-containing protein n=1 Tax=Adineta steineri TaxID=433720 RepID=A0A813PLR0_9BILA|nr:unnamed protein product [Adineta steineri]